MGNGPLRVPLSEFVKAWKADKNLKNTRMYVLYLANRILASHALNFQVAETKNFAGQ